ncbi:MAG: elongation factor 4 [Candidatus Marinimicrobia bacterium]|nr:elongation factor 4 [Candidatus Neomarinimicrobiota bacterium]MBT4715508.1 elongation factor 4 [Candidatus Neomarinimicrobiota bacterium]MBT4947278.1 elongation factor 4 [Candidatus Neomarinimicrobiota bacterium]MBT5270728.1 elongation factor 4 [Candidatus Neomarinimicrobiota bacterium]MBT6011582.1 elongation factor 4 [Candidatus Neomarinimicrobiota bacterium]
MRSEVRNFCIIAHIDHGKSTLADRLLEETHTLSDKQMMNQVLDDMDLERERGITIKSHPIQVKYSAKDGNEYVLNLIDTPGHVDFSYEVSRSLDACEGALLLVDAAQGVEAQTVSNAMLAVESGLEIIPIINKIDLQAAQIENVQSQIVDLLGCDEDDIIQASAKADIGIQEILEAVVDRIPAPEGNDELPLRALVFDSTYDAYRGAVAYVRVLEGQLKSRDIVRFMASKEEYEVAELGYFKLKKLKGDSLRAGDVGYIIANIKDISEIRVGDTVTTAKHGASEALTGYREVKPMVYSGVYPIVSDDYANLRAALEKLNLNDAALTWEPETSSALGFGFRVGYLGLLHMEIVQERLEREFAIDLITTQPNVKFKVFLKDGSHTMVDKPSDLPDPGDIDHIDEPYVTAEVLTPPTYIGNLMKLIIDKRGIYKSTHYLDESKVQIYFEIPLSEIIFDFYDQLKSTSRGYASFDYEPIDFRRGDLVKLDILIATERVDALSQIVHRDKAYDHSRKLCAKLKELIPRQQFEVPIQGSIGQKIIARETVRALRKNVTAKCYGGDITRKRKLLEKQKAGKKRMKQVGRVEVPQDAFLAVLKLND